MQMKNKATASTLFVTLLVVSGCIHLDNPPSYTFSGIAVNKESREPISNATVRVYYRGNVLSLFPVNNLVIGGSTKTDESGAFELVGEVKWPAFLSIYNENLSGEINFENETTDRKDIVVQLKENVEL